MLGNGLWRHKSSWHQVCLPDSGLHRPHRDVGGGLRQHGCQLARNLQGTTLAESQSIHIAQMTGRITSLLTVASDLVENQMVITKFAQRLEMLIQFLEQDIADRELIWPLEHGAFELVDDFLLAF